MTLPIDDVWLTGGSTAGEPGQRFPPTDANSMASGSNDSPMTSPHGATGSLGPDHSSTTGGRPSFDPRTFDPGPDLPPLPNLRPLPTIKPLGTWPPAYAPSSAGSVQAEPVQADDDRTIRVAGVLSSNLDQLGSGPITTAVSPTAAPSVRHRRRAAELDAPAPARASNPNRGRRVLVLGGSGTVGSAIARALARQDARVAVHHATRGPGADQVVAELAGSGHVAVRADVADADAIAALIMSVDEQFDGLDIVINAISAGDSAGRPALVGSSLSEWTDAWTGTLTVDVLGAATVVHAAAAAFIKRGRTGRIILVAANGHAADGAPNALTTAAQQAVGVLGSALAIELAPHGIGVVVVGSGASSTHWSPEALAETVAWLAFGPAIALPGAVLTIAG